MSKKGKEDAIRPCSKTKCSLNELINTCGGVFGCDILDALSQKPLRGILSASRSKDNTLFRFCLWAEQPNGKLRLIRRFAIVQCGIAQMKGFFEFVQAVFRDTEKEVE